MIHLGSGLYSNVYLYDDTKVIKIYSDEVDPSDDENYNMFLYYDKEVKTLLSLKGIEGVPMIYNHGITDNGNTFILLERAYPREHHTKENIAQIKHIMTQVHARGITHGDIKWKNIMYDSNGQVMIIDWNLANTVDKKTDLLDIDKLI